MKKNKSFRCEWELYRTSEKKKYLKCKRCGRIKRQDLPDVQFCSGSNAAYKAFLSQITGRDLTNQDLKELENIENEQELKDGKNYREDEENENELESNESDKQEWESF